MEKRVAFTEEDKNILKANADWGKEIAPLMADHFYDYLGRDEEMDAIMNAKEGRTHRLRETFVQWFHEMFTGMDDWGNGYADRRWRIGLVHVQIGIGPQHVIPAMAVVIHAVGKRVREENKNQEMLDALSRICMIDLAFIEQAYVEVSSAAVLRETGWTEGLFQRLIKSGAGSM
ncbi:protoglobin domain-containing protein [Lyngbya aestuarii]|uniref:protoglobin domain-containing protein n=1 Tax=Lyngbya aestuarii TaxID=118322 RepID=UPI00403D8614